MVQREVLGDHSALGVAYDRHLFQAQSPGAFIYVLCQELIGYNLRKRFPAVYDVDPEIISIKSVSSHKIRYGSLKSCYVQSPYQKKRLLTLSENGIIHGMIPECQCSFFDVVRH